VHQTSIKLALAIPMATGLPNGVDVTPSTSPYLKQNIKKKLSNRRNSTQGHLGLLSGKY